MKKKRKNRYDFWKKAKKSAVQSTMQMEEVMQKDEKPTTKNPLNSKKASKNAGFKSTLKQELGRRKQSWNHRYTCCSWSPADWQRGSSYRQVQRSRVEDDHDPKLLGRYVKKKILVRVKQIVVNITKKIINFPLNLTWQVSNRLVIDNLEWNKKWVYLRKKIEKLSSAKLRLRGLFTDPS